MAGMLVMPSVGVVMGSLPGVRGVRGVLAMRLMIVLMMAVVMHVNHQPRSSFASALGHRISTPNAPAISEARKMAILAAA